MLPMDHRYICRDCGTKWFVPAGRDVAIDRCSACGGPLLPFVGSGSASLVGDERFAGRWQPDGDRGPLAG